MKKKNKVGGQDNYLYEYIKERGYHDDCEYWSTILTVVGDSGFILLLELKIYKAIYLSQYGDFITFKTQYLLPLIVHYVSAEISNDPPKAMDYAIELYEMIKLIDIDKILKQFRLNPNTGTLIK